MSKTTKLSLFRNYTIKINLDLNDYFATTVIDPILVAYFFADDINFTKLD